MSQFQDTFTKAKNAPPPVGVHPIHTETVARSHPPDRSAASDDPANAGGAGSSVESAARSGVHLRASGLIAADESDPNLPPGEAIQDRRSLTSYLTEFFGQGTHRERTAHRTSNVSNRFSNSRAPNPRPQHCLG